MTEGEMQESGRTDEEFLPDYEQIGRCMMGVAAPHTMEGVADCGEPATHRVWWDDWEKNFLLLCPKHFTEVTKQPTEYSVMEADLTALHEQLAAVREERDAAEQRCQAMQYDAGVVLAAVQGERDEALRWKNAVLDAGVVHWALSDENADDPEKLIYETVQRIIADAADPAISELAAELEQVKAKAVLEPDEPQEVAACFHPAWARQGVPYNHQRCVKCGAVYKSALLYVGQYDALSQTSGGTV